MNASDIIKAKQNQTLYKAYYKPNVLNSSVNTNVYKVSSIFSYISSSQEITIDSYASCNTTVYNYVCNPTYMSYEMANQVNGGAFACGGKTPSKMQWKNVNSTIIYAFSSIYSTFETTSTISPSDFYVTSTTVMTAPTPVIVPLINLVQGTNFATSCDVCNNFMCGSNACCHNCASGLAP